MAAAINDLTGRLHPPMDSLDSASLTLDFGQPDSGKVNAWKRMPECDEFVGAR